LCFFILLALTYAFGLFFLPTGVMQTLPLPSLVFFEGGASFSSLVAQTIAYNLYALLLIVVSNHFRVDQFTFGYLPLYANTILLGLFAGTDSFSGNISARTIDGWILFLQIGFLEFSAYILVCTATVSLAMFHADKWRGEQFRKIRKFIESRLSLQEVITILVAIGILFVAAYNEWKYVG